MSIMRTLIGATLVLTAFVTSACENPTCQNSCRRIYSLSECGITDPALDEEEQIRACIADCEDALANTGELGDYNPDRRTPTNVDTKLENELQAAAWMDCVWERECEDLHPANGGYCAPI
jgi:hypothetical protein